MSCYSKNIFFSIVFLFFGNVITLFSWSIYPAFAHHDSWVFVFSKNDDLDLPYFFWEEEAISEYISFESDDFQFEDLSTLSEPGNRESPQLSESQDGFSISRDLKPSKVKPRHQKKRRIYSEVKDYFNRVLEQSTSMSLMSILRQFEYDLGSTDKVLHKKAKVVLPLILRRFEKVQLDEVLFLTQILWKKASYIHYIEPQMTLLLIKANADGALARSFREVSFFGKESPFVDYPISVRIRVFCKIVKQFNLNLLSNRTKILNQVGQASKEHLDGSDLRRLNQLILEME